MNLFAPALACIFVKLFTIAHANEIAIGGLFHTRFEEYGEAFANAIQEVNDQKILGDFVLVGINDSVPEMNPFQAGRAACRLFESGVVGIFGPHSPSTAVHVQSICDAKEVPHIETRWDWQQRRGACSINLHPHPTTIAIALIDVIKAWGWDTFTILYEDEHSLVAMAELLSKEGNGYNIVLRQLAKDGDYRETLKDIQRSSSFKLVIDCSYEILLEVFTQAQQVGIMIAEYTYIITNLDFQRLDLEAFKYSGTNMTGFRMNSHHEEDGSEPMTVVSALMHDSVQLFAHALSAMSDSKLASATPLDCNTADSWAHGYSLINYIKSTEITGLTGAIKFDHEGFRTQVELSLIELTEKDGIVGIGTWNSTLGLNLTRAPVYTTIVDNDNPFANKTLIVMISLSTKPYAMLKEDSRQLTGNNRYEGFAIDLIQELGKIIGFNYTFQEQEKGTTGSLDKATGKWNGMLGKVMYGEADLAITDLTINQNREKVVDFTMPFMSLGIQILYKKPTTETPKMLTFMDPFSMTVWMFMLGAYIIVSVQLFVMARISPYEWTNPYPCIEEPEVLENQFSMGNSFWFTIGSLLQQGSEIAPIAVSTRMVAGIWWFFTLIMVSSYTANLAAFLVVKQTSSPFDNVKELADNTEGIKYGAKAQGSTANFFIESKHETYRKMGEFMLANAADVLPNSNDEGVAKVENEKYAFLMESTAIEYTTQRNCEVAAVGGLLDSKGYGIAMQKNSPYRDKLNTALLELQETGRLTIMKDKWWKEKRGGGKCTGEDADDDGGDGSLGLDNVGGVFVVLAAGVLIACFITVFELIWSICQTTQEENVSFKAELMEELKFVAKFHGSTKPVRKYGKDAESEAGSEANFKPLTLNDKFTGWFENTDKKTPIP